jgi:hypothetical protein
MLTAERLSELVNEALSIHGEDFTAQFEKIVPALAERDIENVDCYTAYDLEQWAVADGYDPEDYPFPTLDEYITALLTKTPRAILVEFIMEDEVVVFSSIGFKSEDFKHTYFSGMAAMKIIASVEKNPAYRREEHGIIAYANYAEDSFMSDMMFHGLDRAKLDWRI